MNIAKMALCVGLLISLVGCYTASQVPQAAMAGPHAGLPIETSLFPSDVRVMPNDLIDQILNGRITLPSSSKLAVIRLGRYSHSRFGKEGDYLSVLSGRVTKSSRVETTIQVPSILLSHQLTVPVIREAAARLQCELVLVYYINEDVHYESKFLGKDKTDVYSSVTALLLHTRTGIIPFTTVIDQAHEVVEEKNDNYYQMLRRASYEATAKALEVLGDRVARYLDSVKG